MQATATSRLRWVTLQLNYAYGHALDTSSNGGFDAFGINPIGQINPNILKQNYGNADYDTRHYISSNYTIKIPHFAGPKVLVDNWVIAGTIFHNSGYPFSVADGTTKVPLMELRPLAKQLDNNFNHHCGGGVMPPHLAILPPTLHPRLTTASSGATSCMDRTTRTSIRTYPRASSCPGGIRPS